MIGKKKVTLKNDCFIIFAFYFNTSFLIINNVNYTLYTFIFITRINKKLEIK